MQYVVFPGGWLVVSMSAWLFSSGCALDHIGKAEGQELNSDENARKNIEAIRAMQADWGRRSPAGEPGASNVDSSQSESRSSPPAELPLDAIPIVPSPVAASPNAPARAKLPRKFSWTPSPLDRPSLPDRPVPAYTIPAPVGPDYPGTISCVPDGLGGQRCLPR